MFFLIFVSICDVCLYVCMIYVYSVYDVCGVYIYAYGVCDLYMCIFQCISTGMCLGACVEV